MILVLALVSLASAGDVERAAAIRQASVVDVLAAEIARARSAGADRQELAGLMARFRVEAEVLAGLEAPMVLAATEEGVARRTAAARALTQALAAGRADAASRTTLVAWLGDPSERLGVLERALAAARATNEGPLRTALALDVAEQAAAVGLVFRYDAEIARLEAGRLFAQAALLRGRTMPGQSGGLDLVVEAERTERDARAATARHPLLVAEADRAEAVRLSALLLSGEVHP